MTVRDKEGNPLFKVPLRPSFDQGISSSQDNVSLKSIQEKVDLAAADSRRTFRVIGSASGTITGTKQAVDSLKKEAIEELVELRMDVKELKDGFMNEVSALSQGHEALREDVLVIRDGQARVKDAMNTLSRVESKLNKRLDHMEKTTNSRVDNIDLTLASMNEMNKQIMEFLENQGDGVQSIWTMLKNQQTRQPGPSNQEPDLSAAFYAEDAFVEDSSTKGEKVGEGETNEVTNEGWQTTGWGVW
jgi:chromosome segregation ATPase